MRRPNSTIARTTIRAGLTSALLFVAACTPTPGSGPPVGGGGSPPGAQFSAQFRTASDFYGRFEREVFHRNIELDYPGGHDFDGSWTGDHDMSCAGPDTQRRVHAANDGSDPEAFWWCAPRGPESGHVMTSMGDIDGYSIVAFSPNRSFRDLREVCWAVNLTYLGARKWPEVVIIPESDYRRTGGSLAWGDIAGNAYGDQAVGWSQTNGEPRSIANGDFGDFDETTFRGTDKATRVRHCLTDNGNGTLTFRQERSERLIVETISGRFPDEARVIFADHSYTPLKDGPIVGTTWHWDDIAIT
ncbi:MAG: hypothetical protein ACRDZ2_03900 [Ilumatobacteraceae bacterium]